RHTIFSRDWSSDVCSSDLSQHQAVDELLGEHEPCFSEKGSGGKPIRRTVSPTQRLRTTLTQRRTTPTAWWSTHCWRCGTGWSARSEERRVGKECSCRRSVS